MRRAPRSSGRSSRIRIFRLMAPMGLSLSEAFSHTCGGAGWRLLSHLTLCRYATSPFQGDTACATLRPVAPLLRFSKKILLTFRHGA